MSLQEFPVLSVQMLRGVRPYSILHRLFLTILGLPSSRCRAHVFTKVSARS